MRIWHLRTHPKAYEWYSVFRLENLGTRHRTTCDNVIRNSNKLDEGYCFCNLEPLKFSIIKLKGLYRCPFSIIFNLPSMNIIFIFPSNKIHTLYAGIYMNALHNMNILLWPTKESKYSESSNELIRLSRISSTTLLVSISFSSHESLIIQTSNLYVLQCAY